jgi:4-diphosphocytidyl-2-C-methyl-D-erythritol kinase
MSGLGGSATDLAAIIKWAIKKYKIKLSTKDLQYIALEIGSDVPFFLSNYAKAWVTGYGEIVKKTNVAIPKFQVLLTNIKINTKTIYDLMNNKYQPRVNVKKAYKALNTVPFSKHTIYNDMWAFANTNSQKLAKISHKLSPIKNLILSGSGGSFIEIK